MKKSILAGQNWLEWWLERGLWWGRIHNEISAKQLQRGVWTEYNNGNTTPTLLSLTQTTETKMEQILTLHWKSVSFSSVTIQKITNTRTYNDQHVLIRKILNSKSLIMMFYYNLVNVNYQKPCNSRKQDLPAPTLSLSSVYFGPSLLRELLVRWAKWLSRSLKENFSVPNLKQNVVS